MVIVLIECIEKNYYDKCSSGLQKIPLFPVLQKSQSLGKEDCLLPKLTKVVPEYLLVALML